MKKKGKKLPINFNFLEHLKNINRIDNISKVTYKSKKIGAYGNSYNNCNFFYRSISKIYNND